MKVMDKAKAVLAWVWSWLVWTWAKVWGLVTTWKDYVVDPPAAHLKVYFWVVLGGSVVSYFFWASLVGAFNWFAVPFRQAMAPVVHVNSAPETLLPKGALFPSQMPAKLDAPKAADVPPPVKVVVKPPAMAPVATAKPVSGVSRPHKPKAKPAPSPFPG